MFRFYIDDDVFYMYNDINMGNRNNTGSPQPNQWATPEVEDATNITTVAFLHTHPSTNPVNQGDANSSYVFYRVTGIQLNTFAASPTPDRMGVNVTQYVFGSAATAGFVLTTGRIFPTEGAGSELVINVGISTNIRRLDIHQQYFWAQQSLAHTYNPLPSLRGFVQIYRMIHP